MYVCMYIYVCDTCVYLCKLMYIKIDIILSVAPSVTHLCSQAEIFTGKPGKFVALAETIEGFKGLLEGKFDHLPEQAFYMVGPIEEVVEKAAAMAKEVE